MELKEFSNQQIAEELQEREDLSFLLLDCSDEADPTGYRYLKENHKGYLLPLLFSSVSSLCGIGDELERFIKQVESMRTSQKEYFNGSGFKKQDALKSSKELERLIDSRIGRIRSLIAHIKSEKS